MKTRLTPIVLLAGLALLTACTGTAGPQGPQGPAGETGPAGPSGPQGPIGNANVKTYRFTSLSGKWTTPGTALGYTHTIRLTLPITDDEANSLFTAGAILIYVQDFNSNRWWALPTYLSDSDLTFQQESGTAAVRKQIALSGRLRSGSGAPVNITDTKVILVFSTQQGNPISLGGSSFNRARQLAPQLRHVDLSDYPAVHKALGLGE
ncbi:MAG: hypothetical protein SFU83_20300 [Meiothermus sp.]|nr:hypothetical protein [Meiothermus sp.]